MSPSLQRLIEIVDRWVAPACCLVCTAPQSFDTNPSCSFLPLCHVIEETVMADLCWQLCYEVYEDEIKGKALLW